jgi:hypothetical protein
MLDGPGHWSWPAAIVFSTLSSPMLGAAQSAITCPPISFPDTINLAKNPSFENTGRNGSFTVYQKPFPNPAYSAAADWLVHSNNADVPVTTALVPTTVPVGTDPAGHPEGQKRMLHVIARGSEGGVYQTLTNPPPYVMFSVWIFLKGGQVVMQLNGGTTGPNAWSEKTGEWEELRVCTNGKVPVDTLVIYNQDPKGGEFYLDRVELRRTLKPDSQ